MARRWRWPLVREKGSFRARSRKCTRVKAVSTRRKYWNSTPTRPASCRGPADLGETAVHFDFTLEFPLDYPVDQTQERQSQHGFPSLAGAKHRDTLHGTHNQAQTCKYRSNPSSITEKEIGNGDYGSVPYFG
jgi:hypothetical protein